MKKLYSIALIFILSVNFVNSQILTADHPVTDYAGPDSMKLTAHLTIVNNGSQTLNVIAERFEVNTSPNHFSYFCWVVCYDTSVSISPSPIQIAPGASASNFEGWMGSGNTPGYDEVTYRYYDMNGNSDTLYVLFTYDFFSSTGISELNASRFPMSIVGANPANNSTIISYNLSGNSKSKIIVSNLLGSKVKELFLDSKSTSTILPVSELNSGIYMCNLEVNGMIVNSKKLIVSHQ